MEFYLHIGAKIKEARESQGLSQGELGEKIGYSATAINYYEKGKRKISVEDLLKVATALNKPYDYFLPRTEEVFAASDPHRYKDLPENITEDIMKLVKFVWGKNQK